MSQSGTMSAYHQATVTIVYTACPCQKTAHVGRFCKEHSTANVFHLLFSGWRNYDSSKKGMQVT